MSRELKPYPKYKDSGVEWLGDVPEGWEYPKLSYLIKISSGDSIASDKIKSDQDKISIYPVLGGNGICGYTDKVNTFSNCFAIGRVGALCGNVHFVNYRSWINDNALKVSKWKKLYEKYLWYIFKSINFNQYADKNAQPLITGSMIKSKEAPLPPLQEQTTITTYLDSQTAKIDTLITKYQKLIELSKEKRQAMITKAVTKGLEPNVKMKDSGIEWLGEVPEGWEVKKFKYFMPNDGFIRGPFGSALKKDTFTKTGYKVYEQKNAIKKDCAIGNSYINENTYEEPIPSPIMQLFAPHESYPVLKVAQ